MLLCIIFFFFLPPWNQKALILFHLYLLHLKFVCSDTKINRAPQKCISRLQNSPTGRRFMPNLKLHVIHGERRLMYKVRTQYLGKLVSTKKLMNFPKKFKKLLTFPPLVLEFVIANCSLICLKLRGNSVVLPFPADMMTQTTI